MQHDVFSAFFSIFAVAMKKTTMFGKTQRIIEARKKGTLKEMCCDILSQANVAGLLKITFFHHAADDKEYLNILDTLHTIVEEFFPGHTPLMSYIAQQPANGRLTAEATYLNGKNAEIERHSNYVLLSNEKCKEIITNGIVPSDVSKSAFEQSNEIFGIIGDILQRNGFLPSDIYRQWNYIQYITDGKEGSQNYQEFNDARSIFYGTCEWKNGYPAATGIGTSAGGIMVELCAIKECGVANKPIDNPLQIAAHSYSQKVLDGKVMDELQERTTPKFERARLLGDTVFISGTAAIKGEVSNFSDNTVEQAAETMEIMNQLVSKENIPVTNNGSEYEMLRIYVKRKEEIPAVQQFMQQHYPAPAKHYLVADVCRPELLIEIEGVAKIKGKN